MTDLTIWEGDFEVPTTIAENTSHEDKSEYYPPEDTNPNIIMKFEVSTTVTGSVTNPKTFPVIRGKVIQGKGLWEGEEGFNNAIFFPIEGVPNQLVSSAIPTGVPSKTTNGNQSFTEILTISDDYSEISHRLVWEDGDIGKWTCFRMN